MTKTAATRKPTAKCEICERTTTQPIYTTSVDGPITICPRCESVL